MSTLREAIATTLPENWKSEPDMVWADLIVGVVYDWFTAHEDEMVTAAEALVTERNALPWRKRYVVYVRDGLRAALAVAFPDMETKEPTR